jgi:uncharacterized Zn finger protein
MCRVVWFGYDDLRQGGHKSYTRGLGYVDKVEDLKELPDGVVAAVYGTRSSPYEVRLSDVDGVLVGECSCPWGTEGHFCKHCVAVGLVMLAEAEAHREEGPQPQPENAAGREVDLHDYLGSLAPAELVELLVELAAHDPALHRRLSLRAAGGDLDPAELRPHVDALRTRGALDHAESFAYAGRAGKVLDTLDQLALDHPATVGPLYQQALQHLTAAESDDSAGAIAATAARAVDGFAAACRAAPPDPVELAGWLLSVQLDGPGWPRIALDDFAEALGSRGMAAYWQRLRRLKTSRAGAGDDPYDEDSPRRRVTRLREEYLERENDIDGLVALYAKDLSGSERYLRIGDTLRSAGRYDEAISWLRRGLGRSLYGDYDISDLLADVYTAAGRHAEALELRWDSFTSSPAEYTYHPLMQAAARAGAQAETRRRALAHLRRKATRGGHHADPLVEVLLAAGQTEQAWKAAHEFGCSAQCLFTAAQRRARTHPADAIPVYQQEVAAAIDRKNGSGYARAAQLLAELKSLHQRAGSDFAAYLQQVKANHPRKTSLLHELTRAGL